MRLRQTKRKYLKDLLIEVIANAFYYNPHLTLNIQQKLGVATEVFNLWFHMLQEVKKTSQKTNFRRDHDKKVCILGLTSLLSLPSELLPEESLGQIFRAVLNLLVAYKEQVAETTKGDEDDDSDDDFSDGQNSHCGICLALRSKDCKKVLVQELLTICQYHCRNCV